MYKRGSDDLLISPDSCTTVTKKMDKKLTPVKEFSLQDTDKEEHNEVLDSIMEEAPGWFAKAFSFLRTELKTIKQETQKKETERIEMINKMQDMNTRINLLENTSVLQQEEIKQLKRQIVSLESYSRRDNLIIDGIEENPGEIISEKVKVFFQNVLKLGDASQIQLANAHRLGSSSYYRYKTGNHPRSVIVKFLIHADRERVWRASWKMEKSKFQVREDLPKLVEQNRRILLPCFKAARKDPKVQKCFLKGDVLFLDNNRYRRSLRLTLTILL